MTMPTEDDILKRAKTLCAQGGYVWREADAPGDPEDSELGRVIDDPSRLEYLKRAREQLIREARE